MINMLRSPKDKVDRRQEQMCKASREMEILTTNQKKKKKTFVREIKNVFDRLIGKLDAAEERLTELEGISIETSKTEKQRGPRTEKTEQNSRDHGQLQNV